MRGILVSNPGGPEVLKLSDLPDPELTDGRVLIEVKTAGINYSDILARLATGTDTSLPFIPGKEVAGVVLDVGKEVKEICAGDRVAVASDEASGGYAEYITAPWRHVVKLPAYTDFDTGATIMLQGLTAHYLSDTTYPIEPGHKVLIHAGAGGMGRILTQIAKKRGAFVFTTVSTHAKAQASLEAGADHVILYTEQDFCSEIQRITSGHGVNVVYDGVGKDTFMKGLGCLAVRGCLVLHSHNSGLPEPISPRVLLDHSRFITYPSLWDHIYERETLLRRTEDLFSWIASGELKLKIWDTFDLDEATEAHRQLESRETMGKLLFRVG